MKSAHSAWLVIETSTLPHVLPDGDWRDHDVDAPCWCAPYQDDGVIVHNSMDQRERYERGELRCA